MTGGRFPPCSGATTSSCGKNDFYNTQLCVCVYFYTFMNYTEIEFSNGSTTCSYVYPFQAGQAPDPFGLIGIGGERERSKRKTNNKPNPIN